MEKWCHVKKNESEELGKDRRFLTEVVPFRTPCSRKARAEFHTAE